MNVHMNFHICSSWIFIPKSSESQSQTKNHHHHLNNTVSILISDPQHFSNNQTERYKEMKEGGKLCWSRSQSESQQQQLQTVKSFSRITPKAEYHPDRERRGLNPVRSKEAAIVQIEFVTCSDRNSLKFSFCFLRSSSGIHPFFNHNMWMHRFNMFNVCFFVFWNRSRRLGRRAESLLMFFGVCVNESFHFVCLHVWVFVWLYVCVFEWLNVWGKSEESRLKEGRGRRVRLFERRESSRCCWVN